MGRVAIVQSVERVTDESGTTGTEIHVDPGGGALLTVEHFADPGDDSQPFDGDVASTEDSAGKGSEKATGYSDPTSAKKAAPGAKRIYSRSAPGVASAEVWLKPDGTIVIKSVANQPITIESDGPVVINSPDVRVGKGAGQPIARVGDLVAGVAPILLCTAPGNPAVPANPLAQLPTGYAVVGQIISGATSSKA